MSDKLLVQLNTDQIVMEPGGTPFEVVATVQNLGDVVDQYTVELSGLDQDWFTAPVTSVGLFPRDREQVRISLHPPKRPGLRAGAYPFRITVRSRGGTVQESVEGTLNIRGMAVYRVDITPRRMTARGGGTFKVQIANTGNADVRLALEGRDAENACRIRFSDEQPLVPAGNKKEIPVNIQPLNRPWVGPERPYDFTITARPQDAGGDPQTVPGQFTHKPLFGSWAPVRTAFTLMGFVVGAMFVVTLLAGLLGSASPNAGFNPGTSVQIAGARIRGAFCAAPLVGRLCGPEESTLAFRQAQDDARARSGCSYQLGFKAFADAEPNLIGPCTSNVHYDGNGNGVQYTQHGMLFWQKDSNTVYFYRASSLWAHIQGKSQVLYGPGTY